jgi:hypothetical protein
MIESLAAELSAAPAVMVTPAKTTAIFVSAGTAISILIALLATKVAMISVTVRSAEITVMEIIVAAAIPVLPLVMAAPTAVLVMKAAVMMVADNGRQDQKQDERVETEADPGQHTMTVNDDRAVAGGGEGIGHKREGLLREAA